MVFEIRAYILDMTKKGIRLASKRRPKGTWFPRSTVHNSYSQEPLMFQEFLIDTWILKKKGLLRKNKKII